MDLRVLNESAAIWNGDRGGVASAVVAQSYLEGSVRCGDSGKRSEESDCGLHCIEVDCSWGGRKMGGG